MLGIIYQFLFRIYIVLKWNFVRLWTSSSSDSTACLVGKTAIVTGGAMGIGHNLCLLLASRGCRVIIADIADAEKSKEEIIAKTNNENVLTKYLDLSSFEAIRKFALDICQNEPKIDILIHNAACPHPGPSKDKFNTQMQVNCMGPFLLTHLLLEPLKASPSARVLFAGSITAHFTFITKDNIEDEFKAYSHREMFRMFTSYRNSKLFNVLLSQEFARRLRKYGIRVNSYDPGSAITTLTVGTYNIHKNLLFKVLLELKFVHLVLHLTGATSIFIAAQTGFHLASSKEVEDVTDGYFYRCQPFDKPLILKDREFCEKAWITLEKLIQLEPQERL